MSTRAKGNRSVLAARAWLLEEDHWDMAEKVEQSGNRGRGNKDLFGLFDLHAIKARPKVAVAYVQVATNRPHVHQQYQAFADRYPDVIVYQIVRYDGKNQHDPARLVVFFYYPGKKHRIIADIAL